MSLLPAWAKVNWLVTRNFHCSVLSVNLWQETESEIGSSYDFTNTLCALFQRTRADFCMKLAVWLSEGDNSRLTSKSVNFMECKHSSGCVHTYSH